MATKRGRTARRPRHKPKRMDPCRDRRSAVKVLLKAREDGSSLRQAAAAAGVHVATVCRWQNRSPALLDELRAAERIAWSRKHSLRPHVRPRVPWRTDCPTCGAAIEVRRAFGGHGFAFWRCSCWPDCPFASWRPRAPQDCPECGAARFWSHSRLSIGCPACFARVRISRH
jgi:hypothetical protein